MKRILIAESDREMRNTLSIVLQVADYEVDTLPTGESINTSDVMAYDMLVCDLENPPIDSTQLLNLINTVTRQIPVVVISEFGHESSLNRLIDNNCVGFLQKPFKSKELLAIVETLWHKAPSSELLAMEGIA